MLDARTERSIAQLTGLIRAAFGSDLVGLILYGSAAGEDFVPHRSDLNFAIVFEKTQFSHLRILHEQMPAWSKFGMAMPLLLDRRFLDGARDVFPMEFLDIKAQRRLLYGEDVFATLTVESDRLRYQSEHEARSKLLRLQALYVSVGADRQRLQSLVLDSVKSFAIIMRNLLRLRCGRAPIPYRIVLREFAKEFAVEFPIMERLIRVRENAERWADDPDEVFSRYLEEVERLVDLIDLFPAGDSRLP